MTLAAETRLDAIVYATAQAEGAELVTEDRDLRGLPGVTYLPKAARIEP